MKPRNPYAHRPVETDEHLIWSADDRASYRKCLTVIACLTLASWAVVGGLVWALMR